MKASLQKPGMSGMPDLHPPSAAQPPAPSGAYNVGDRVKLTKSRVSVIRWIGIPHFVKNERIGGAWARSATSRPSTHRPRNIGT